MSSLEVLYLVTKLREALDEDAARHLADRADRIAREVDGLSIGERALRRIPCPLLQDDRCTAYDWRPPECRGYGSFDADACRGLLDDFDTWPPPIPMARYAAFKNVQAGLMAALAEANHPVQILDLALAVRIGLRVENARDDWWQSESALEDAAISPWDMDSLSLLPGTPPV